VSQDNELAPFVLATRYWGVMVFLLALMFVCFPVSASSTTREQAGATSITGIDRGVVVEKVVPHGEAEKVGLQEGDILLAWSRGESKGEIQSPFDIMDLETEQRPLGGVTLEGLGGTARQRQTWSLGPSSWGLTTRPNFSQPFLSSYLQEQELASRGKADEIVEATRRWKEVAGQSSAATTSWLATWLFFHNAQVLREAKQWKEADENYQSAVQFASAASAAVGAQLLRAWADAYQQRNDWANAETYLQQSMVKVESTGSGRLLVAVDLNTLGTISWRRGDLGKAEQYYRQALEIRERVAPGSLEVAASVNNLGIVAFTRGDLANAEQYFRQALEIREKLAPGSVDVAQSLNNLASVASQQEDLAKAMQYYRQVVEVQQKLAPGSLDVAKSLRGLGIVAAKQGDLAKAEQYLRQGLEIEDKLVPGSLDLAQSLDNVGNAVEEGGDLAKAAQYYRQALEIQQKLAPDSLDVSASLNNLGFVAYQRGDLANGEQYFRQALEIRQKLAPRSLVLAQSLNNLGAVAEEAGDLAKAMQYYLQAVEIQQKLAPDSLALAQSLDNLGIVARRRGDLAKAERYHRQALAIRAKLAPDSLALAQSLDNLGIVAKRRGDLAKAEQYFRQAVTICEKTAPGSIETARVLADLASLLERQQPAVAAQFYARAVSALESQNGRLGGSEEVRSGFRASHSDIYREYVDLLIGQNQATQAFEILERSLTRILLEMLMAAHIDIRKGADAGSLQQEHSLQELLAAKSDRRLRWLGEKDKEKQVAAFTKEIEDLEKQYQDVEERLRANSPTYAALTQPQPLSLGEIQQLLDADTVLLEYSLGEKRSHVFVVTSTSVNVYELPGQAEIASASKGVYRFLSSRSGAIPGEAQRQSQEREAAAKLGQMLLAPVGGRIQGKRLLIVSDGTLQYIPFAALPSPDAGMGSKVPLIVEHEIVNLPSASILSVLRHEASARKPAPKAVLVVADPVFDSQDERLHESFKTVKTGSANLSQSTDRFSLDRSAREVGVAHGGVFPRLPFSRREAEAIYATAAPGDATEALDFDATKATAMSQSLGDYKVVHLATHGLVNSEHPALSGLVFSLIDREGRNQDGFLRLSDIYNLELSADLVVLSACQTALGKEIKGEGLVGITRGFMYAGSPRVMASLWKVDDEATAELMKKFYEGILRRGQRPGEALRAAQMWMLKQPRWKAPYYWAGFILQGEWK
jgi:CHAT domain-containing protein/Tfp pilus assembly protein PilF